MYRHGKAPHRTGTGSIRRRACIREAGSATRGNLGTCGGVFAMQGGDNGSAGIVTSDQLS